MHAGSSTEIRRRRRLLLASLRCHRWNRSSAAARGRELAPGALETAAAALRTRQDDQVRAAIDRAMRRITLAADLESAP